jgi:hypothetical protein
MGATTLTEPAARRRGVNTEEIALSLFNVNASSARLHKFVPKHGKSEDAARSAELQFRNVPIKPAEAAAVMLGEDGGSEVCAAP